MPSSPARRSRLSTAGNNNLILVLQTNVAGRLCVWLVTSDGRIRAKAVQKIIWHGSESMLLLVDVLLRKNKTALNDLTGVVIVRGPGPFTAVRTGLVIANTLGLALHVPVRGVVSAETLRSSNIRQAVRQWGTLKKGVVVRPWYGKEPNITSPRLKA